MGVIGKKASLIVMILIFMSTFYFSVTILPESVRAATLYVGSGPGNYTTIQSAIDAANAGDTVFVYSGSYYEKIVVNKTLILIGENRDTTTINSTVGGDVVNITANWVNITGFRVTSSVFNPLNSTIKLTSVQNCQIINNNVTNSVLSWDSYGIFASNSENNTISDNTILNNGGGILLYYSNNNIISNNTLSNNGIGTFIQYSDNNTVANNTASNMLLGIFPYFSTRSIILNNKMLQDGIYIDGDSLEQWNTHIIDTSNTVNGKPVFYWKNVTGGQIPPNAGQVILANCTSVTVENQTLGNVSVGIELGFSSNVKVSNNNLTTGKIAGIAIHFSDNSSLNNNNVSDSMYGIYLYTHSNNNTISDSTISNNWIIGIFIRDRSGYNLVINNTISHNRYGIYSAYSTTHNSIINNNISSNTDNGIDIFASSYDLINNNSVSSNDIYGIYISVSNNLTVINNAVTLNKDDGIFLRSTDDNVVSGNIVSNNLDGIEVQFSDRNNITGNDVLQNRHGAYLIVSDNNTIAGNNFSLNTENGFTLTGSDNNTVTNNIVSLNGAYGIYLEWSHNRIYHNNFVQNVQQAYDRTGPNQWDDGYPSGGNYWSDYAGSDIFFGPNQDLLGSDGIGDTPYDIYGLSGLTGQDRYPLMSPFQTIHPRPPTMLKAELSGQSLENVTLTWDLSLDDGMGLGSVVEYKVFRDVMYNSAGSGYVLIASLPNGTSEFVNGFTGEGNPSNYFYQVCAVDKDNLTRCAWNQAGKSTRPLSKGPNLVSIPLIQPDETIQTVLQTLSYDNAWIYDPINQELKSFSKLKPYGQSLEYLNHTMGIWVNVTQDSNLTVAGVVPTSTTIDLQAGWNLLGFPSFDDNYTVADLKAAVVVERIEGYDGLASPYFLRVMNDSDFLQAGIGYWIRAGSEMSWTVENV